jgi:hypothetical protein
MSPQQIVPVTRLGLVMSITGFAVAALLMAHQTARDALATPYSLAWVLFVILMVYPPRLIPPGAGWARATCRTVPATIVYVAGAAATVAGATWAISGGASVAVGTASLVLVIAAIAATVPGITRSPRPRSAQED